MYDVNKYDGGIYFKGNVLLLDGECEIDGTFVVDSQKISSLMLQVYEDIVHGGEFIDMLDSFFFNVEKDDDFDGVRTEKMIDDLVESLTDYQFDLLVKNIRNRKNI